MALQFVMITYCKFHFFLQFFLQLLFLTAIQYLFCQFIKVFAQMSKDKIVNQIIRQTQSRLNHHLVDARNEFYSPKKKSQHFHTLSENKHRVNAIKINRARLPHDFFPKSKGFENKLPNLRVEFDQGSRYLPTERPRRVESQRLHHSPEKVSLYGLFDPQPFSPCKPMPKTLAIKRKFQSREQPKRDMIEMKRLFTPGSNSNRPQLQDIFPVSSEQMEIITSMSSKKFNKSSPRKQHQLSPRKGYHMKMQQFVHDPQKFDGLNACPPSSLINLKTIEGSSQMKTIQDNNRVFIQSVDLHNMTFFNLKSSCLPPIKRALK